MLKNVIFIAGLFLLGLTSCQKDDVSGQCGVVEDYWVKYNSYSGRSEYFFQMDFDNKVQVTRDTWYKYNVGDYICFD